MSALPGQRAAQRPLRAAKDSQGVLGRLASSGGIRAARLISYLDGEPVEFYVTEDGVRAERPYTPGTTSEEGL